MVYGHITIGVKTMKNRISVKFRVARRYVRIYGGYIRMYDHSTYELFNKHGKVLCKVW